MFAKIFAVKFDLEAQVDLKNPEDSFESAPNLDKSNQPLFVETGLFGDTEVKMNAGHCLFQGVRFSTTSYNHGGALFFLVISVFTYLHDANRRGSV